MRPMPLFRQRWWQFSLRTMLLLMLLVAVASGWLANEHRRWTAQGEAFLYVMERQSELEKKNHGSMYAGEASTLDYESVQPPWWLRWTGAKPVEAVTLINLNLLSNGRGDALQTDISDDDLRRLLVCTKLKSLAIPRSKVTDAGLAYLAQMPDLVELDLSGTAITDDGLKHLAKMPELRYLVIGDVPLDGSGLAHLKRAPHLRKLILSNNALKSEHTRSFNGLQALDHLYVSSNTAASFHLTDLPSLSHCSLHLGGAEADVRLEQLPALKYVEVLTSERLEKTRFHLRDLPQLERIFCEFKKSNAASKQRPDFVWEGVPKLDDITLYAEGWYLWPIPSLANAQALEMLYFGDDDESCSDDDARQLASLPHLKHLYIHPTKWTDASLRSLAQRPGLQSLHLKAGEFTEKGLQALAAVRDLETLSLVSVHYEGDLGAALATFPALKNAEFKNCTADACTLVGTEKSARHLERLTLTECAMGDVRVGDIPTLEWLEIDSKTAKRIEVENLPALKSLQIPLGPMQKMEQLQLGNLPQLESFSLYCRGGGGEVPDDTFAGLLKSTKLTSGNVKGLKLSPRALADLKQWEAATGLKIQRD